MNNIFGFSESTAEVISNLKGLVYWEIRESLNFINYSEDAIYDFHINDINARILYSSSYLH